MSLSKLDIMQRKLISDPKQLEMTMHVCRFKSKKVVFTNGCFDILHKGHVQYLAKAADLGDFFILGLNSDRSVKTLKGEGRPVNNEQDRAIVLSALHFIDAIVIFDEDTPERLIRQVKPDVLVKGGDWQPEQIAGADFVKSNGGEVVIIDFVEGYSTTSTIEKIKDNTDK